MSLKKKWDNITRDNEQPVRRTKKQRIDDETNTTDDDQSTDSSVGKRSQNFPARHKEKGR